MPVKYIGLLVFLWVVAAIVGGVIEGAAMSENETGVLNDLMSWSEVSTSEAWGPLKVIAALPDFFGSLFNLMTFDFAFFDGQWELVRWVLLAPLMATVVFGLIITFVGVYQRSI